MWDVAKEVQGHLQSYWQKKKQIKSLKQKVPKIHSNKPEENRIGI